MAPPEALRADPELLVSVVVPVRDDARGLRDLLDRLAAQTLPPRAFEVVVGDDGSADGQVQTLADEHRWVRVFPGPPLNSYAARNRAARAARAPALAFCDSDCMPEPGWLEAGLRALERADVVAGLIHFAAPERATVWSLLDIELFLDQEHAVSRGRATTANLFLRRELFERLGGFDDSLPNGGDADFVTRAVARGASLHLAPDVVVRHPTRNRARAVLGKTWAVHRRSGTRAGRAAGGPGIGTLRFWLPPLDVLLARRRLGRSLGLNRGRLDASGLRPGFRVVPALVILYGLVAYVMRVAKLVGWLEGRRSRASPGAAPGRPNLRHPAEAQDSSPMTSGLRGRP
jgi:glycosyltransferase involved in cell wall biosynthesis